MKRFLLISALALLSACGNNDQSSFGEPTNREPPPLAENPPLGASDIDAIVEQEKAKSAGNSSQQEKQQ